MWALSQSVPALKLYTDFLLTSAHLQKLEGSYSLLARCGFLYNRDAKSIYPLPTVLSPSPPWHSALLIYVEYFSGMREFFYLTLISLAFWKCTAQMPMALCARPRNLDLTPSFTLTSISDCAASLLSSLALVYTISHYTFSFCFGISSTLTGDASKLLCKIQTQLYSLFHL